MQGDITREDVDRVVNDGRDVRRFVRPYDRGADKAVLPSRVIHRDSAHSRKIDREDAHEIDRMHNGKLRTDRCPMGGGGRWLLKPT